MDGGRKREKERERERGEREREREKGGKGGSRMTLKKRYCGSPTTGLRTDFYCYNMFADKCIQAH